MIEVQSPPCSVAARCAGVARHLIWISLALFVTPLFAVGFDPIPINTLAQKAELVVQGRVLSKSCQRDAAGRIYTSVELEVVDLWKGAVPSNPLQVVHGGGILGERQSLAFGQVDYAIGEEVVAFLVRNTRGEAVTLGLMQGKFHVWQEAGTGVKHVVSPFHGLPENVASKVQPQLQSPSSSPPERKRLPLAELKSQVREATR
jgi:hypothetical protein